MRTFKNIGGQQISTNIKLDKVIVTNLTALKAVNVMK